jgi:hypothetical protein
MQGTGSDRCCVTATYTREGYVSGKEQEVIDAVSQLRTRGKGTYLLLLESRDRARDAYNAVVRWGAGCPGRLCGAAVTLCAQRMHVKLLFTVDAGPSLGTCNTRDGAGPPIPIGLQKICSTLHIIAKHSSSFGPISKPITHGSRAQ